uniref:SID1 transmembrane family, member 2 n=1 Tax=Cyprinus carpio TaxID=7962 RepID=A0A8C1N7A2_CYPCA
MSVCSDGVSCSRLAPPGFCFSSQADDGSRMLRFCPVLLVLMLPACGASVVIQRDAQFDVTYDDTVTSDNQTIYSYNHTVSRNKTEGVRVSVELLSESAQSPVLFVVRQKQAVLSFQVPLILRGLYQRKYQYTQVGRTLCQPPTKALAETQFFYLDVSTLSSAGVHYQLRVSRVDSFTLQTDKKFSFNATPSQPQRRSGVRVVISVCVSRSVQCPVYELDNNVAFIGMYQTMTTTAAITVQRKDFPSNSFYVVVVVKTEDEACGGPLRFYPLLPGYSFVHSVCSLAEVYVMGMLFCLGIFMSFYLLTFLVACVENKRYGTVFEDAALNLKHDATDNGSTLSSEAVTDSLASTDGNCGYRSLESVARSRQESLSSVEEDDYDTLADIDSDKNIVRTKKFLCVSDLARKDKRILSKKYQIYFCSFNNILSNLGYVLLGLLFLLIILQRDILHNRALERNESTAVECGIPKHFGLYYAMGTALMMEGLLSACYHVCPNYTNFQFDTSFMYMIAGLCMLKLYQKRHPDINASAYSAYACLAAVIFFSVLGVVFGKGNTAFWIVFSVIHILATLLLSTQLYYMGRWRLNSGILRRMLNVIYTDCIRQCSGPMYIDRMVLLVMGNIVNWSLAAYGLIKRPNDFASYLLAIAICNLLLYFTFYIIMKLRSGERIQCLALVCILFTAVVWGFALFFFLQGLSTWQKTPAESREHNRECILLSFFDDHDIWHFLSSIAMFGSFLVLLTMDDDLDTVQRDKIYVF